MDGIAKFIEKLKHLAGYPDVLNVGLGVEFQLVVPVMPLVALRCLTRHAGWNVIQALLNKGRLFRSALGPYSLINLHDRLSQLSKLHLIYQAP